MKVIPIKTHKITIRDTDVLRILDQYIKRMPENSVLAITSKIIAICEGRVAGPKKANKDQLIVREAERYLPRSASKYNFFLTIKNGILLPSAGIDESNAFGQYILWPKDPQKTANAIRAYLIKRWRLKQVGVLITDSKTTPLRWGVTGVAVAHSGFKALNDYRGKKDLFGRTLKVTQANVADALAGSAVLLMGEGKEQTPLALIEKVSFVQFQKNNPSSRELQDLHIALEDDLYAPLLGSVKWKKGEGGKARVVVFGIFDGLHQGHQFFLQKAAEQGDELIAVAGRDETSRLLKNKTPRHAEKERVRALQNHPLVSKAILGDIKQSSWAILKRLQPDIICVGHDQTALRESLAQWIARQRNTQKRIRIVPLPKLSSVKFT